MEFPLSLRFLAPKNLLRGVPKTKQHPLFALFSPEGKLKGVHEQLEDAKDQMAFKDSIIIFKASGKVELTYTETQFE